MKIALVTPYDYPYPGGVTEHIRHLDREFQRGGHETRIIAASTQGQEPAEANVIKVSGKVLPLPFNGSTARLALSPEIVQRVEEILNDEQFDVVHLHEPEAPLVNWAVLRASQAVKVGTFHAYSENKRLYKTVQPFIDWVWLELDGRIFVSPALRDAWEPYTFGELRVIPNGIDTARFAAEDIAPIAEFDDGRPNLLFVGRLEPRKGFPHLLNAYPQIKRSVPEARLLVAGAYTDEDKARLLEQAGAKDLHDVHWIGRVSGQDLPRYYRTATVFCVPSTGGESFGIILLEAMAAGVPIVASGIAGYRSVMQDGAQGRFVAPGDESAFAQAIVTLLGEPETRARMAEHGRQTAAQYDWSVVAPQVLKYYQELLEKRPRWRVSSSGVPASTQECVAVPDSARMILDIRGHLKVEGWDRSEVFASAQGKGEVHVDVQDGMVSITGVTPGQEYTVYLPQSASVHITYAGGNAQVRGLDQPLEIERVVGNLKLQQIVSAHIRSTGGHLSAYEVYGPLECQAVQGHLTVHRLTGRLVAEAQGHASVDALVGAIMLCTGGKAKVSFTPHPEPGFDAGSSIQAGDKIELALDPATNATVTVHDAGGIRSHMFGDGLVPIKLDAPGGVRFTKSPAFRTRTTAVEKALSFLFDQLKGHEANE
jgi:phosphatidylinositol alpha-mannosyltransferase